MDKMASNLSWSLLSKEPKPGLSLDVLRVAFLALLVSYFIVPVTSSVRGGLKHPETAKGSGGGKKWSGEDFHKLTDKLTLKIMQDIDALKAKDPNWGRPQGGEEDMEEEGEEGPMGEGDIMCDFKCPEGESQVKNEDFKPPIFKDCKNYDKTWDKVPGASNCCAKHQRCYYTCGRERTQCDGEFQMCMESICEELHARGELATEKTKEACSSAMGMIGMIIMEPGCKLYPEAQGAACRCVLESPMDPFASMQFVRMDHDISDGNGPELTTMIGQEHHKELRDEL